MCECLLFLCIFIIKGFVVLFLYGDINHPKKCYVIFWSQIKLTIRRDLSLNTDIKINNKLIIDEIYVHFFEMDNRSCMLFLIEKYVFKSQFRRPVLVVKGFVFARNISDGKGNSEDECKQKSLTECQ